MTEIRSEKPGDALHLRRVHELAFGSAVEADLVDSLRQRCPDSLSLVADAGGIVGHILFTPVLVESAGRRVVGMGLGPMAVLPDRQRQGIGSRLVRRGLELLRARGCTFVVVVGHPEYYPRFGFGPASRQGLACQWESVPDAAFMAMILDPLGMSGIAGVVRYRDEFTEAATP